MTGSLTISVLASAASLGCAGIAIASVEPRNGFWGPALSRGFAAGANRYALTFDDGPTPGGTDRMLDALAAANAIAAFFVIGRNVREHPDLLRRIDAAGHLIGNHTFDHSRYGMMRRDRYWLQQVQQTDDAIADVLGKRPALFRPPLGVRTAHTYNACRACGKTVVNWRRRAIDGSAWSTTERILRRLGEPTQSGDVLLLHDGVEPNHRRDSSPTVQAIGPLVRQLRGRGLEPVRLDALLGVAAYLPMPSAS